MRLRKSTKKTVGLAWFAKGGGIAKIGPYKNAVEAAAAMELVGGGKPTDFAIWPERVRR